MKNLVVYDVETTGLRTEKGAEMFTFATCDAEGNTAVHHLDIEARQPTTETRASQRVLEELWSDESASRVEVGGHNIKFDLRMTQKRLGRELRKHRLHDSMAAVHIFDNHRMSYSLDNCAGDIFGYPRAQDDAAAPYLDPDWGYYNVPRWKLEPYQHADVERTALILLHYLPQLRDRGWQEIYDMECSLIRPTLDMEDRGVMIHRGRCREMIAWLEAEAAQALEDYQGLAGVHTTPNAANVGRVIEDVLGLKLQKLTKNKDRASTDKAVMFDLRDRTQHLRAMGAPPSHGHPLIEAILRYRAYRRGVPIIQSYMDLADEDGLIHPSIKCYGTKTGRESCSEPNLQNVSKEAGLLVAYPIPARRCFRPEPGYVNVHIDYAGIEARLLTHFSGDPALRAIFTEGDGDFHSAFAAVTHGERWRLADKKERKTIRSAVKNGDFGLAYGAGAPKFLRTVGLTARDRAAYDNVVRAFPSYCNMSKHFIKEVRAAGCVHTIFGRRLYVPGNKPYMGTNYVVQGTAAGILKRAQVRVDRYLRDATGNDAGMILPIHDEIVIRWPRARLGELRGCLRDIRGLMIDFPQVSVPLEIEVELSTRDWATARKMEVEG